MPLTRRTLFAAGGAGLLVAQAATRTGARHSKAIVSDNKLRIAMPAFASDPFFPADGSGDNGIDMDLARGIAAELGVEPVFDRSAVTFDAMVQQLISGQADTAIGKLSRTLQRGRSILYSRPYAMFHQGLLANRLNLARIAQGKPPEQIIRDFSGDLGVIEGSSFATYAATTFPHAQIRRFAGWNTGTGYRRRGSRLAFRKVRSFRSASTAQSASSRPVRSRKPRPRPSARLISRNRPAPMPRFSAAPNCRSWPPA